MSVIFPTSPAKVRIHPLPSKANFISYINSGGAISLKAWMPSGLYSFTKRVKESYYSKNDQFFHFYCKKCPRNCQEYHDDTYPVETKSGRSYWLESMFFEKTDCFTYYAGYIGQDCPLNNSKDDIKWAEEVVNISDTTLIIHLNKKLERSSLSALRGGAALQAGYVKEGEVFSTPVLLSANTYYHGDSCWGENRVPDTLREMVQTYFYSEFNNDLMSLSRYKGNIELNEQYKKMNRYSPSDNDKFLCQGYDNLMMLDSTQDVQAFYTMLMAGFTPLPELPQYMLIPMDTCTIVKDDTYYLGYKTEADSVGRHWYVSSEGFLIGQLDETYSFA